MPTNVQLDEKLMAEVIRLGKRRSKRAIVEEALREYVQRRKQVEVLGLFGQIDYEASYDYKALRRLQHQP